MILRQGLAPFYMRISPQTYTISICIFPVQLLHADDLDLLCRKYGREPVGISLLLAIILKEVIRVTLTHTDSH